MSRLVLIGMVSGICLVANLTASEPRPPMPKVVPLVADELYRDSAFATLIETSGIVPGHGWKTVEFRRGDTTVRSTVHYYHNVPTGDSEYSGTFYPAYLVMFEKTHPKPDQLQSLASLLDAAKQHKVQIVQDQKREASSDQGAPGEVRVVKLRFGAK